MAYEGYFKLGDTEIANAARAFAYADGAMPTFGLDDCTDCEGLLQALGDEAYTTPAQDGAPWVDSSNPALSNFWGVYPLGVEGIDDSTRQVAVTELTGDGGVVSLPRQASRQMRFDTLLVGRDERAVMAGFHWLNRALDGIRCGEDTLGCTGVPLEFFSSCPPACDYSACPDTIIEPTGEEQDGWYAQGTDPQIQWFNIYSCPDPLDNFGIEVQDVGTGDLVVTRVMDGLIPGAWYKMSGVVFAFNVGAQVSARGTDASIESTIVNFSGSECTDASLTTLWFQAHSPVMYLDFTVPQRESDLFHGVDITRLTVTRADPANDIYKTTWPNDGSLLNGWTLGSADEVRFTVERDTFDAQGQVRTMIQAALDTPGSTSTILSSSEPFLLRTIRGLTPGSKYRVAFSGAYIPGDDDASQTDFSLRISMDGVMQEEEILPNDGRIVYNSFFEFEFTATADRHEFSIGPGVVPFELSDVESTAVSLALFNFSVEGVVEGALPLPDSALEYRRTLYRVTAMTGPTIQERYDKSCGFMIRVTFGLVAGIPDQYGDLVNAGSALNQSSFVVGDVTCINDEAVRHNLIENPSIETTVLPWSGFDGDSITTRAVINDDAPFGIAALNVSPDTPGLSPLGARMDSANMIPVTGGGTYTISAYVGGDMDSTDAEVFFRLEARDSFTDFIAFIFSDLQPTVEESYGSDIQRHTFTFSVPPDTAFILPSILVGCDGCVGWEPLIIIDGIMLEQSGFATPYFDGSFTNAEWDGTPEESTSTYTPAEVTNLIDPDCPPLPEPPQPPSIDEECIVEPEQWDRYVINVPASEIPLYSSVQPVVTILTGDTAVRQLRMRWYPNPGGVDPGLIDPCDFEAEMIVSYVPPDAEFVVDSIAQDASAVVSGGLEQPATHLLYGPDGGPVEWPALSCNVPYLFAVDVDTTDDVSELDVLLSLGLKV